MAPKDPVPAENGEVSLSCVSAAEEFEDANLRGEAWNWHLKKNAWYLKLDLFYTWNLKIFQLKRLILNKEREKYFCITPAITM